MNEVIRQLKDLTEVDQAAGQTREQLAQYPAALVKLQAAEDGQQRIIEQADAVLKEAQQKRRQMERDVAALRERIKKNAAQQAAVKTNKEYQAISQELEGLRAKIDALETAGLEELELEDAAATRRRSAAAQLAQLQAQNQTERERIQTLMREKQDRLERLTSERQRRLALLPESWQMEYNVLQARHPGSACAPLAGNNCGGCHWALVPYVVQRVRRGEEIIHCDHCRRILYAPES